MKITFSQIIELIQTRIKECESQQWKMIIFLFYDKSQWTCNNRKSKNPALSKKLRIHSARVEKPNDQSNTMAVLSKLCIMIFFFICSLWQPTKITFLGRQLCGKSFHQNLFILQTSKVAYCRSWRWQRFLSRVSSVTWRTLSFLLVHCPADVKRIISRRCHRPSSSNTHRRLFLITGGWGTWTRTICSGVHPGEVMKVLALLLCRLKKKRKQESLWGGGTNNKQQIIVI